jgi:hypothetical protein
MTTEATAEYTALFPKTESAVSFAANLSKPGNWAVNIVQKGRKVTWDAAIPEGTDCSKGEYLQDSLERAGYFGSTQSRKATVNGIKAPFVW